MPYDAYNHWLGDYYVDGYSYLLTFKFKLMQSRANVSNVYQDSILQDISSGDRLLVLCQHPDHERGIVIKKFPFMEGCASRVIFPIDLHQYSVVN